MFPGAHRDVVPTTVSATASATALFATGVARPSEDDVGVVERSSTRTLKVLNQKDNRVPEGNCAIQRGTNCGNGPVKAEDMNRNSNGRDYTRAALKSRRTHTL